MIKNLLSTIKVVALIFILFSFSRCAPYYIQNQAFHQHFKNGDMSAAEKALDANKVNLKTRNRALYLLNKGTLAWLQKDYNRAIAYFEKADIYIEDFKKNILNEGLALLSNPRVKPYRPEDFESVLTNFYKALSYIEINNLEEALVECRKVNRKLYGLNDKYPKKYQNRYSDDAFAHVMMGLIYDANNDYNNAFIAYRNAYKIYEENYNKNFNIQAPEQLKKDILRTAKLTGLRQEYDFFKRKFGMEYKQREPNQGTLVFFWLNGLGPVKDEWSIGFDLSDTSSNYITFRNSKENISFEFYIGDRDEKTQDALSDLGSIYVAFPKYRERVPYFVDANLVIDNNTYPLYKAEDINAIAFKTLHDRMLREIANSLLRVAIKKTIEVSIREENKTLGFIANVLNNASEIADTRNWQTLPYAIYYNRINVNENQKTITLQMKDKNGTIQSKTIPIDIPKGRTKFINFNSLQSTSFK